MALIKLWKYSKNLSLLIKSDLVLSCKLLKKLSQKILNFEIKKLPLWLYGYFKSWFGSFSDILCQ